MRQNGFGREIKTFRKVPHAVLVSGLIHTRIDYLKNGDPVVMLTFETKPSSFRFGNFFIVLLTHPL